MAHRAALEAAVGALPTADDETWSVPAAATKAAGLEDDEAAARMYVLKFSEWARDAIVRLPPVPRDGRRRALQHVLRSHGHLVHRGHGLERRDHLLLRRVVRDGAGMGQAWGGGRGAEARTPSGIM